MAAEIVAVLEPGLTLTATLRRGGAEVAAGIALAEVAPELYEGSVPPGTPAGVYAVLVLLAGVVVASGVLQWDGVSEVLPGADPLPVAVPGAYAQGTVGHALGKLNLSAPEAPVVVLPGAPAAPGMCRVYGYLVTPDGQPAKGVAVDIELAPAARVGAGRLVAGRRITARTDAQGRLGSADGSTAYVDVMRNDALLPAGSSYLITCPPAEIDHVPAVLAADLFDISSLLATA